MIVSNTTPISNFLNLGRIEILTELFKKIHIPRSVNQELNTFFSANSQWNRCIDEGFIVIHDVKSEFIARQLCTYLHLGEAETLSLCMEKSIQLCLIDDKDARTFAKINKLSCTGTLGILIHAKKTGVIKSVKNTMNSLRTDHHFWISEPMYNRVLQLSGEKSEKR
jgi:hypothetical protein